MNQKRYRAAAIGHTGAGNYCHGLHLAYRRLENVEFIAISDPDPVGREKASMETNAPSATRALMTGTTLAISSCSSTGGAPGRVDSPPTSIIVAPSFIISSA